MSLPLFCLVVFCFGTGGMGKSGGVLKQDPSKATSRRVAQDACAAEVVNPPLGESEALVEDRGSYGACMMD